MRTQLPTIQQNQSIAPVIGAASPVSAFSTSENDSNAAVTAKSVTNRLTGGRNTRNGPDAQDATVSFADVLDIVNPLQHIPIVNTVYRELTGDKISSFAQVAGSTLYGGTIGLISGIVNAVLQDETGKDVGATVLAALTGDEGKSPNASGSAAAATMVADNSATASAGQNKIESVALNTPSSKQDQIAAVNSALLAELKKSNGKQPFGGVLAPVHHETNVADAALDNAPPPSDHPPQDANGHTLFSLAKVPRLGNLDGARMPIYNEADARYRPANMKRIIPATQQAAQGANQNLPNVAPNVADGGTDGVADGLGTVPLPPKDNSAAILGLASTPSANSPGNNIAKNSDPIPPQLIEDMIKMGLDKYQNGVKSGTLRGNGTVDING